MVPVLARAGCWFAPRPEGPARCARSVPCHPARAVFVAGSPAAARFLWEVLCAIGLSCEQSRVVITRAAAHSGASCRYRAGAAALIR